MSTIAPPPAADPAADSAAAPERRVSTSASLSPSRAADFKACPLRYRLRVIDRLPEPASAVAVRGTVVHAVLEELFDLPAAGRTLEAARGLLPAAWERVRAEDPDAAELFAGVAPGAEAEWLDSAADLLAHYFALEDPTRLEPASREEYVEVELAGGLVLRGVIDRLDASAAGALRVVDYKTGRSPAEAWEAKALFQLKFYALVLWRSRGVVPAVLQLLYLADQQRLTYAPEPAELVAFERQLRSLWTAVEHALDTGDFRSRTGPLCRFCDFSAYCPSFGGTPPPYPGRPEPVIASATGTLTQPVPE